MTQTMWDVGGDVRRALRSIVGDPQLGTAVLADPHVMTNLLKDLLPDLPRESALLVAAAQCDLVGVLSGHLDQGLDLGTSSRLAAGWFAERMPFTDDACALGRRASLPSRSAPIRRRWPERRCPTPCRPVRSDLFEATAAHGHGRGVGRQRRGRDRRAGGPAPRGRRRGRLVPQPGGHRRRARSIAWGSSRRQPDRTCQTTWRGVTAIAAGRLHSLALTVAGTVVAWGSNGFGQARVPAGLGGVTSISAGAEHSLAVADGRVIAWGGNGCGQTDVPAGPARDRGRRGRSRAQPGADQRRPGHRVGPARLRRDDGPAGPGRRHRHRGRRQPQRGAHRRRTGGGLGPQRQLRDRGPARPGRRRRDLGQRHPLPRADRRRPVAAWGSNDCGECDVPRRAGRRDRDRRRLRPQPGGGDRATS